MMAHDHTKVVILGKIRRHQEHAVAHCFCMNYRLCFLKSFLFRQAFLPHLLETEGQTAGGATETPHAPVLIP